LLVLLINQQWTAAIALVAVLMFVVAWYGPRLLQQRFGLAPLAPDPGLPANWQAGFGGGAAADPALIQRSAAVLEDYLRHTAALGGSLNGRPIGHVNGGARANGHGPSNGHGPNGHVQREDVQCDDVADPMTEEEALEVLGLQPGAQEREINEAHRRLVQLIHPDRGGSHYLTVKVNQAKGVLLGSVDDGPRRAPARSRKSPRRRQPRREHL
jgi:hypothetical protein